VRRARNSEVADVGDKEIAHVTGLTVPMIAAVLRTP
jgi:hypothetical protein